MLVFVLPLRNPETAQNWAQTEALCNDTVSSALAQLDPNVRVIVACKELKSKTSDQRLTVLREAYPTPEKNWEAQHFDKYAKIARCLVEARKYAPCYVMKLDADDLVSNELASHVSRTAYKPGYYIRSGYKWRDGSKFIELIDDFHLTCGSSNILWCEKNDLPSSVDEEMGRFQIMRFGHNITVQEFEKLGTPLMPIYHRSVVYRIGHGENITSHLMPAGSVKGRPNWKFWVGRILRLLKTARFLTPHVKAESFGRTG